MFDVLAPCGVYCGACPAFQATCLGCVSDSRDQARSSKWSCKVRDCCLTVKKESFCGLCSDFPCELIKKKLLASHPGESRFRYRHEIPRNFEKMKELGLEDYLEFQKKRWTCPFCEGTVRFYRYTCDLCGKKVYV